MANTTEKEDGDMDVNSPEHSTEMQDVIISPEMEHQYDNTPCQVDKHLDFVAVNKSGGLLMGSSNLTGRYWGGSVWYYDDPALAPSVEKCVVGYEVGSGVADGAFMDNDRSVFIGQDCGAVEFLSLPREGGGTQVTSLLRADEHLDAVLCVRVTCSGKTVLTGSADMSIRAWDCHTTVVVRVLSVAHSQQVTGIAAHPSNEQLFLSSGMDGNVLLWDLRCPKPASCIYRDWDDKPECVTWLGDGESSSSNEDFLVGSQSGTVVLRNTGALNHDIASLQALDRPLFRLASNPTRPRQVALCGNDSKTLVVEVEDKSIRVRYEDDRHRDFVRGLAWKDSESLVTCGWDKLVFVHQI